MGRLTTTASTSRRPWAPWLCAALILALASPICAAPHPVMLYMPDAPALSTLGPDGLQGIVGEVTARAAVLAGYDLQLQVLPWVRAQRTVQAGDNLLIIPLSRTPDREASYTWIVPIMTMDRAFFTLDKRVDSFEQARKTYKRIAVGLGTAQEQKLREEGFSKDQIYSLKIGENPAQMLLLGRVDAWFNGVPETRFIWRDVSHRPLLQSAPLMTSDLYLACSKNCDKAMVEDLRKAVETLRDDGTIQRIVGKYVEDPKAGQ